MIKQTENALQSVRRQNLTPGLSIELAMPTVQLTQGPSTTS